MTNYNERLDEALKPIRDFAEDNAHSVTYEFSGNFDKDLREDTEKVELLVANAKQAITSLIKELVAEAKPPVIDTPSRIKLYADDEGQMWYDRGHNDTIARFEQNLLKALEEV